MPAPKVGASCNSISQLRGGSIFDNGVFRWRRSGSRSAQELEHLLRRILNRFC